MMGKKHEPENWNRDIWGNPDEAGGIDPLNSVQ